MRVVLSTLILFLSFEGAGYAEDSARSPHLTVAASANLQAALEELKAAFEKTSGVTVKSVVGSSGRLTAQIENGAPFDVFLSADMPYPQMLYQKGWSSKPPQVYAYGVLVLWSMKDMDLSPGVAVLKNPEIKKIALADPRLAPYGREAIRAMEYYKIYPTVKRKLVYGESLAQANDFIASRSADIGFTARSTVLSPNLKKKGVWIEVPAASYNPIAQGGMILKHGERNNPEAAEKFYKFLFLPEAKTIFKKYGYAVEE